MGSTAKFRADLYHRLNGIKIVVEPLRHRPEDIPHLIEYFNKKYCLQLNEKPLRNLNKDTVERLISYDWPGNVRELQNVLKRIILLGENKENIDQILKTRGGEKPAASLQTLVNRLLIPIELLGIDNGKPLNHKSLSLKKIKKETLNRIDKEIIAHVLEKTYWNRTRAAKILKVSYKLLINRIGELNIRALN